MEEENDDNDEKQNYDSTIMPELIFALEASDHFLKHRVMNFPEIVVSGTHNTEKEFIRRLEAYKDANREDETVLNYFDEQELHPEKIGLTLFICCGLLCDLDME